MYCDRQSTLIASVWVLVGGVLFQAKSLTGQELTPQMEVGAQMDIRYQQTRIVSRPDGVHFRTERRPTGIGNDNAQIDTFDDPQKGEEFANDYYRSIGRVLGFGANAEDTLDGLLEHLGYSGLSSIDLETLDPVDLMDKDRIGKKCSDPTRWKLVSKNMDSMQDQILVARFFSPKTTDVSGKVSPTKYSWRKLVRLKSVPGSVADSRGVASAFVLTNVYSDQIEQSPFDSPSPYFQVIIVRKPDASWAWPICFLIFEGNAKGAIRKSYAETSWDAGDESFQNEVNKKYYVGKSCIQCHGEDTQFGRLQYLDSDHWLDRVESDDDFGAIGASRWPALFDAKDQSSQFLVLGVLRKLNQEIHQQNQLVDRFSQKSDYRFQTKAASNWLRLHQDNTWHIRPEKRGFSTGGSGKVWDENDPKDIQLTHLLNRYCFRCHSSVAYHVFDKQLVLDRANDMADFVESGYMPQDRQLDEYNPDRTKLIELLRELKR